MAGNILSSIAPSPPAPPPQGAIRGTVLDRGPTEAASPVLGRSLRGLDWFNFFVADAQTGFGPFIAVYLTAQAWTETEIGFVLSIGTLATIASQIPAGALVDAMPRKGQAARLAIMAITFSALLFLLTPAWGPIALAEVLHGFASCMMVPAVTALSLRLVGPRALGERLGRNARFAAIGNGISAAVMGVFGTYVSERSVFGLTAALAIPSLLALRRIREPVPAPRPLRSRAEAAQVRRASLDEVLHLLLDRRLLGFAACVALFHLSNAAMLPLAATALTRQLGVWASLVISACILVPQVVVALISPEVGRMAQLRGRRPILLLGFAALPLRALLLAGVANPVLVVAVQALDGVSGAVFGVLLPLVAADLTRGTGRFNLCMGALGLAVGVGATLSTAVAGPLAGRFGNQLAFDALAFAGMLAVLAALAWMPETKPEPVLRKRTRPLPAA